MTASTMSIGQRRDVNGAQLYVEEHGQGDPLILVQPGLLSSASWQGVIPLLAERFHVITFDHRGHGQSAASSVDLSYELLADDTAALADTLNLSAPFVGGWSDGGEVALQFGLRHPGRARALIAGATSLELGSEKTRAGMREMFHIDDRGEPDMETITADFGQSLLPMMRRLHPGGEDHWQQVMRQSLRMWLTYPGFTRDEVSRINEPTLVLVGDRDEHVPVEEAVRLYRWLPNAELAILAASDHMRPIFDPRVIVDVFTDFLQRH
jgi:pimeloyl-ACP methyl ester carboxylesterase